MESHLLQMRGLKQALALRLRQIIQVASFTDAWIETGKPRQYIRSLMSHLLQMRGLKLLKYHLKPIANLSHLLQMRGLKRVADCIGDRLEVASFTDAWIETKQWKPTRV